MISPTGINECLSLIREHPGISLSELSRLRDVAHSRIRRQIRALEKRRLIRTELQPARTSGPCLRACYALEEKMLNPERVLRGVTPLQARVLLNATDNPQAPAALNSDTTTAKRNHLIEQLVTAGLLERHPAYKSAKCRYTITPDGRQLAALLERLEAARHD